MTETSNETIRENPLAEKIAILEQRLAQLEQIAHSEHTIGKEALQQIADHVAPHVLHTINEHLRKSVLPVLVEKG